MIAFETSVRIERPIEDVFAFVSDPLQLPLWNSAVQTVQISSGEMGEPGSKYSMVRDLPTGRVENELEVFVREYPRALGIRTTSGPTPFVYRYRFDSEGDATVLGLDAEVELPAAAVVLGPLAARGIKRSVEANFAALRQSLEETVARV
jgi:uncharacterized protein YndB with AHSA1/START domain